ncbi:MAG: hypothetical protein QM784_32735 [Polyangiaceae bacterium]
MLPPDVNASLLDFAVVYEHPDGNGRSRGPGKLKDRYGPIRFGLGAVRGLGESALKVSSPFGRKYGKFSDLFDFAKRVDSKRLNKGVLEALIQCGAFNTVSRAIGISRARCYAAVDRALERSRSAESRSRSWPDLALRATFRWSIAKKRGTRGLSAHCLLRVGSNLEMLRREKDALGCYVSGHPLSRYGRRLSRLNVIPTIQLSSLEESGAR